MMSVHGIASRQHQNEKSVTVKAQIARPSSRHNRENIFTIIF